MFPAATYRHRELSQYQNFEDEELLGINAALGLAPSCAGGPCEVAFLLPYRLYDGDWLYLVQGVQLTALDNQDHDFVENVSLAIGLAFAVLFAVFSFVVISRIGRPVTQLAQWAEDLRLDALDKDPPNFRFSELDVVADRLRGAFARIADGVEKEKRFLKHRSHELRTPLSVLLGNLELLDRLTRDRVRSEPERLSLERQYNALADMRHMTETLLWVHRQTETPLDAEDIDVPAEVESIAAENRYLLEGKQVCQVTTFDEATIEAPRQAFRIVLSNLVCNARQHTSEGEVRIRVTRQRICVENVETVDDIAEDASGDDYGFGLGLELVQLICDRLGWGYEMVTISKGRVTTILFRGERAESQ